MEGRGVVFVSSQAPNAVPTMSVATDKKQR